VSGHVRAFATTVFSEAIPLCHCIKGQTSSDRNSVSYPLLQKEREFCTEEQGLKIRTKIRGICIALKDRLRETFEQFPSRSLLVAAGKCRPLFEAAYQTASPPVHMWVFGCPGSRGRASWSKAWPGVIRRPGAPPFRNWNRMNEWSESLLPEAGLQTLEIDIIGNLGAKSSLLLRPDRPIHLIHCFFLLRLNNTYLTKQTIPSCSTSNRNRDDRLIHFDSPPLFSTITC
jgi:hypothetical protein